MARKPPKQQARRKKTAEDRKKQFMSILLAFLMVVSLGGIFFSSTQPHSSSSFEYEDYDFELVTDSATGRQYFQSDIEGQPVQFYTLPQDTQRLDVQGNLSSVLDQSQVLLISAHHTPTTAPVYDEIRFMLDQYSGMVTAPASLTPNSSYAVATCENATAQQAVMEVITANQTSITAHDSGCIQASVREIDFALFRDLIVYKALGVI